MKLRSCRFWNNSASDKGGAIHVETRSHLLDVQDTEFDSNMVGGGFLPGHMPACWQLVTCVLVSNCMVVYHMSACATRRSTTCHRLSHSVLEHGSTPAWLNRQFAIDLCVAWCCRAKELVVLWRAQQLCASSRTAPSPTTQQMGGWVGQSGHHQQGPCRSTAAASRATR